jgi:hypothetical protein
MKTVRSAGHLGVLVFAALVAVGACSSDKGGSGVKAPEELRAPAAEVTAGLKKIQGLSEGVAAAAANGERGPAQGLDSQIQPQWQKIEGTVKANDQDAYITFEDSFAVLAGAARSGDEPKAAKAAADVAASVQRYLAKYPG